MIGASIAAWFVQRLGDVKAVEEDTRATLDDVLTELQRLHLRLDALELPRSD